MKSGTPASLTELNKKYNVILEPFRQYVPEYLRPGFIHFLDS